MNEDAIDWSACTFEGARRAQIFDWAKMPVREQWRAIQDQRAWLEAVKERRRERGLPYICGITGERYYGDPEKRALEAAGKIEHKEIDMFIATPHRSSGKN